MEDWCVKLTRKLPIKSSAKLAQALEKYWDVLMYLVFGALTTLVNIVSYAVLAHWFNWSVMGATATAWALSVTFAYITNRVWVFESKASGFKAVAREAGAFVACRVLTGLMDMGIMFVLVEQLHCNDLVIKIISNILVIVANYIASKLVIFRK